MTQKASKKLLSNPSAVATPLMAVVIDRFGGESLSWEPETLEYELQKQAEDDLPEANFDKIHALATILTTDRFWNDPKPFMHVCNALSGQDPILFQVFDPPYPDEIAWGIMEALLNEPLGREESLEDRLDGDIIYTISKILDDAGFLIPPRPLDFVPVKGIDSITSEEDPEVFDGIWRAQRSNVQVVEEFVAHRARLMMQQLESLDLSHGKTEDLMEAVGTFLS